MPEDKRNNILVVGDDSSLQKAGILVDDEQDIELVGSLAEAAAKQVSGDYDRVIIDPVALDPSAFEVLADTRYICLDSASDEAIAECAHEYIENEPFLRAIFEVSQDAIVILDDEGRFVEANPAVAVVFGMDRNELIGKRISDFMEPEFPLAKTWTKFLRDKRWSSELKLLQPNGAIYEIDVFGVADVLPGKHLFVAYDRKTERELAQARDEADRRAREMESFFASIADGVAVLDSSGSLIYMNEAGRKMLSVAPGEPVHWLDYKRYTIDGKPILKHESPSWRALRGEAVRDIRVRMEVPCGNELLLSLSSTPILDNAGKITGATILFHDISKRIQFEEQQKELLIRERHITDVLQKSLVPPDVPRSFGNYEFVALYKSAMMEAEVGGDFYDVFELGPNLLGILIGDVAGKGLAAAITVASARYTIRSYAYLDPIPAKVMTLANEALSRNQGGEMHMLTAFFAVLDLRTGEMSYSNAGHEPPLTCSSEGAVDELYTHGRPLGVYGDFIYTQARHQFESGDRVVMVTDGITEARYQGNILFGREGIIDYLKQNYHKNLDDMASGIYETARQHAQGRLQDDAAIIIIESKP